MPEFLISKALLADCHYLGRLSLCHVLLQKKAVVPWFILVPDLVVTELYELPDAQRAQLTRESDNLARLVKERFRCDKINVGAIGNMVPQLHVHVIGRRYRDPCWPGVVWGRLGPSPDYTPEKLSEIKSALMEKLGLEDVAYR